ncbi:NADH dehydrogenase (quinone) [Dehalogenimonas lykanthroporepellens BL-DC-9]|jgi:NADH-quinone oxidoreductase subunit F|nr:NADH dehydrogenase (quinone) [Dehalogenimonas lykanthroporepellens BL-DC-9]
MVNIEMETCRLTDYADLESYRANLQAKKTENKVITICCGTGCLAYGASKIGQSFKDEIKNQGLEGTVSVKFTGCQGFCERGPLVVIRPENILYQRVKPEDVSRIVTETIRNDLILDDLLYTIPSTNEKVRCEEDVPFYKKQLRLVFGTNGYIDPTSLDDYIQAGGYQALNKVLSSMSPDEVVDEIKISGLRGRGGGGFATGAKWEITREAPGELKYVICNCDEGDPGAFMDRSLMEGNPHSIIEGMVIAAYAVGARQGYIYIRNEYPVALKNSEIAIKKAEEKGLLGKNILGTGFDFSIKISRGGGAFVCGESTALMASIEGRTGEPRANYIHTSEKGLWERPTLLNNVETLANIPLIINKGAEWFYGIGTGNSKGTKIFSLVGKVHNTGLIEVPMGITLREIIYEIGGGIPGGKKFKAVQTGGPSGGCLPEEKLDLSVDFDELSRAGSMMGSGAMIVMDEDNCMVDIARYFLSFLEEESCGKCVPCREGLKRMRQILDRIIEGKGQDEDIELLIDLSESLTMGALCGLGGSAGNPVLSTIRHFKDEYVAHIQEKRCPAGVCKPLIRYYIVEANCNGCSLCIKECPADAISFQGKKQPVKLDQDKCTKCGACYDICRLNAVEVK